MNIPVLMVCLAFGYMKIDYFGWNSGAESEAELICNGIMLLIFALSILNNKKGNDKC